MALSRRSFILTASGIFALGAAHPARVAPQPRYAADPFTLGVASGFPRPDGFVLWTRLAPDPVNGGGMPTETARVGWEVADDEGFRRVIARGTANATPQFAHSVHVDVNGLRPGRWYWYRFHSGGAVSRAGRTRTAPAPDAPVERMRFALASCQHYEQGYFSAYRHMSAEDLDCVAHVGDYIYESSWGRKHVRKHNAPEPVTLDEYRNRHALYKSDEDLQAAHAAFPWLVTWDDHEVQNDYAGDHSQERLPPELFRRRRLAAYQAYYEHMPLPAAARPHGRGIHLHATSTFGALARFWTLDGRQHRAPQVCPRPGRGGSNVVDSCDERLDPRRSLLGVEQERWLFEGLSTTRTRWNLVVQQTLMAQLDRMPGEGQAFWTDGWDGYPVSRERLLNHIRNAKVANPLVLGGDLHVAVAADLRLDFSDPRTPAIATEFVTTSITSDGPPRARIEAWGPDNPHIKYADPTRRGYTAFELSSRRCMAHLRTLDDVRSPDSRIRTLVSFAVEEGRPGAQRV